MRPRGMTTIAFVVLLVGNSAASAADGAGAPGPGVNPGLPGNNPEVFSFGNYQRMLHAGDIGPKAVLKDVVAGRGWYALGALAGLGGEIVVADGAVFLSHGSSGDGRITAREPGEENATLLVASKVDAWREFPLPTAIKQADLQALIAAKAGEAGLNVAEPFPFLIRGDILNYRWHVINGAIPKPGLHGNRGGHATPAAMAAQFEASGARMAAEVVGFFAGDRLTGVITHAGEKIHAHLLDPGRTMSGHLDSYDLGEGAVLSLPVVK